jgi:molybdopterin-guanine dinucleotide biosynthesis protein A
MPFVTTGTLQYLLKFAGYYAVVVPSINGCFQPLCDCYHKTNLPVVEELIIKKMEDAGSNQVFLL